MKLFSCRNVLICLAAAVVILVGADAGAQGLFGRKKDADKEKKTDTKKSDGKKSSGADFSPPPAEDAAANAKVRQLVAVIESKPSGVIVNNRGKVETPPGHKPYNADGTRNENFKVTPDYQNSQASMIVNHSQRQEQAKKEIMSMGRAAVPELCRALVFDANEHRTFYASALGEIRDPRAVPALIKYMDDGKQKVSMAPSMEAAGYAKEAADMKAEGEGMMAEAAASLEKITGEKYGNDLSKWRTWWDLNKDKVGPVPQIQLFTADPQ